MKPSRFLLFAALLVVASPLLAQDHGHEHGHGHDHGHGEPGGMDAELAAFIEMAKPGAEHAFLEKLAGKWVAQGTFWQHPEAPPTQTTGSSVNEMILDGRFLRSTYEGPSPLGDGEFTGVGLDGFDRIAGKYVGTWVDSFQTMIMAFEGSVDASGKVRTLIAEYPSPMGGTAKMRTVTTILNDDQFKYESFNVGEEGEMKAFEILYTRQ